MSEPVPPRRSILPVAIGIALTAAFLLLLGIISRQRSSREVVIPDLTILAPANEIAADSPLIVRFTSARPVSLKPTGWGYERLHLHAWLDGIAHMPAATDIRLVDDTTVLWTINVAARGRHALQLGWADQAHRELSRGRSSTVTFLLR